MRQTYQSAEQLFTEAVKVLREELRSANIGSYFTFELSAKGRVQDGDVKISVVLHNNEYGSDSVNIAGDSIEAVSEEFMRRHGWQKRHAPLALSYQSEPIEPVLNEESA